MKGPNPNPWIARELPTVFLWVWDRGRRLESDMFAAVAPFSLRFTWQGSDETLDVGSLFITEGPASVSCVQSESGPTP